MSSRRDMSLLNTNSRVDTFSRENMRSCTPICKAIEDRLPLCKSNLDEEKECVDEAEIFNYPEVRFKKS
jgi:hypothetical protein